MTARTERPLRLVPEGGSLDTYHIWLNQEETEALGQEASNLRVLIDAMSNKCEPDGRWRFQGAADPAAYVLGRRLAFFAEAFEAMDALEGSPGALTFLRTDYVEAGEKMSREEKKLSVYHVTWGSRVGVDLFATDLYGWVRDFFTQTLKMMLLVKPSSLNY